MTNAIHAVGLTKHFGPATALAGVDLTVRRGTIVAVLGPNGAGKTTLVRILSTLAGADAGRAHVAGYDIASDAHRVRERIALTGQFVGIDCALTGRENLQLIGRLLNLDRRSARRRTDALLDQFELTGAADRLAEVYSGGMRRRLDLAAGLIGSPEVIFLDEPTTGLDPIHREQMWHVIRRAAGDGATVLMTTQHLDEADALADEIVIINAGSVIGCGTPHELKRVVGGKTLVLRPMEPEQVPEVMATLADLGIDLSGSDSARVGVVSVAVDDDALLVTVMSALAERRIEIADVTLRLPTMDDVFVATIQRGQPAEAAR